MPNAVITGDTTGGVTEDTDVSGGNLIATGTLAANDPDDGPGGPLDRFQQATYTSPFGSFTITTGGTWFYTASNSQTSVQSLQAGATITDTFYVLSVDGTQQAVSITITGTNDTPMVSGIQSGAVSEDGTLTYNGFLTVTDVDTGESGMRSETISDGAYGTLTVANNGVFSYDLNNSSATVQSLGMGDSVVRNLTAHTQDGTLVSIAITITGTNDNPVVTSVTGSPASFTESNAALAASGTVTFTDVDTNDTPTAAYTPASGLSYTYSGSGGTLTAGALSAAQAAFSTTTGGAWSLNLPSPDYLAANETLQLRYNVVISDQHGGSTTQVITVNVTGTNDAPTIASFTNGTLTETNAALSTSGTVVATDVDHNAFLSSSSAPISATSNAPGISGAQLNALLAGFTYTPGAGGSGNGSWSYSTPSPDFLNAGSVTTLTYRITFVDDQMATVTQDVTVTITGANDAPVINGSSTASASLTETNATLTANGNVTASDVDLGSSITPSVGTAGISYLNYPVGYSLTAGQVAALTTAGNFSYNSGTGAWNYTSNSSPDFLPAGSTTTLTFPITFTDNNGATVTQNVTVAINGANDAPVANPDTANFTEGTGVIGGTVVTNDSDIDNTLASLRWRLDDPLPGLTFNDNGTYTFDTNNAAYNDLAAGATRDLVVRYTVIDPSGAETQTTLTLHVTGTNDAATIGGDLTGSSVTEDGTTTASGVLTVSDPDTSPAVPNQNSFQPQTTTGTYGTLTLLADGNYSYALTNAQANVQALSAGVTVTDSFTVRSQDGTTATLNVSVHGTNDAPVVNDVALSGGNLTFNGVANTNGTLSASPDFTGFTTSAAISVDYGTTTNSGSSISLNRGGGIIAGDSAVADLYVSASGSDADFSPPGQTTTGPTLTTASFTAAAGTSIHIVYAVQATGDVTSGRAVLLNTTTMATTQLFYNTTSGSTGTVTFDGTVPSAGTYQIIFNVIGFDGSYGGAVSGHFYVGEVTVGSNVLGISEDAAYSYADGRTQLLSMTTDVDTNDNPILNASNVVTVTSPSTIAGAVVTLAPNGTLTIDATHSAAAQALAQGETLSDNFTFTVTDSSGGTDTGVANFTIVGVNDAPVAVADTGAATEDGGTYLGSVATNDSDVDHGAVLTYALSAPVAGLSIAPNGAWTFDANNAAYQYLAQGQTVNVVANYTVSDGIAPLVTSTLTLAVTGTNDAPVLQAAPSGQLIVNGGFETQNFTGWSATTTQTSPYTASFVDGNNAFVVNNAQNQPTWFIRNSASSGVSPITGYSAFNGFDGSGGIFSLTQTIQVASGAPLGTLSFDFNTYAGYGGVARTFSVYIEQTDGTILATPFSYTLPFSTSGTPVTHVSVDLTTQLSALAPGSYQIEFRETIPGNYTGPAAFVIDNISLTSGVGTVFERPVITGSSLLDTASITLGFSDVDLTDTHTATVGSPTITWSTGGTVPTATATALAAAASTVVTDSTGTGTGSLAVNFSAADSNFDFLQVGQTLTVTYNVTVTDSFGATSTQPVTFTIVGSNDTPVIVPDVMSPQAVEDAGVITGTLANDTDADNTSLAYTLQVGQPVPPGFTLNSNGTYSLNPAVVGYQNIAAGQSVSFTVYYQVSDGVAPPNTGTALGQFVYTVIGTNDAPTFTGLGTTLNGVTDTAALDSVAALTSTGTIAGTATDVDTLNTPDTLTYTLAGGTAVSGGTSVAGTYGTLTLLNGGGYTFVGDAAAINGIQSGTVQLQYTVNVTDGHGGAISQTYSLNIAGTNDTPIIDSMAQTATLTEPVAPATLTASGAVHATDADLGSVLTYVEGTPSTTSSGVTLTPAEILAIQNGFLIDSNTGAWTYSLASPEYLPAGSSVTVTFPVTVDDGQPGGTATQNVTITINGTNDAPVILPPYPTGPIFFTSGAGTSNETFATATSIDGFFGVNNDPTVDNSTTNPHVTIDGTGDGTGPDVFTFTITENGSTVILDVDGATFDTTVALYDAMGTRINGGDDAALDPGSTNSLNSYVSTTNLPAGTYYVAIDRFPGIGNGNVLGMGNPVPNGGTYRLHVEVSSPVAPSYAYTIAETNAALTATGHVYSADVDRGDVVTATYTAATDATVTSSGITLTAQQIADIKAAFVLTNAGGDYTFNLASPDYLAVGQSITGTYVVHVSDNHGGTVQQAVTYTITGTNDAPVITGTTLGTINDTSAYDVSPAIDLNGSIASSASDADTGSTRTFAVTSDSSNGTYGTLTLNPDGTYSFAGNAAAINGLQGEGVTITYGVQVTDDLGATANGNFTITINAANDTPIFTTPLAFSAISEAAGPTTNAAPNAAVTTVNLLQGVTDADSTPDADISHAASWVSVSTNAPNLNVATLEAYLNSTGRVNNETGDFSFDLSQFDALDLNQTATLTFTYNVVDDSVGGTTQPRTATITINGVLETSYQNNPSTGLDDSINGGIYGDLIDGLAGDDNIDAKDGNDVVYGNLGDDVLTGGTGNDRLDGGVGNDRLFGGDGNDYLIGGPGNDTTDGGVGNDTVELAGVRNDWVVTQTAPHTYQLVRTISPGVTETEVVKDVENFVFTGGSGQNILEANILNRNPVFAAPYTASTPETAYNAPFVAPGSPLVTVNATDADTSSQGDVVTYAITAGNAAGRFAIDGATGAITLIAPLDFETTPSYTLTVRANDLRGGFADTTVTINATDVNEVITPVTAPASTNVAENTAIGTVLFAASAIEYDAGQTITYTLTDPSNRYAINGTTGAVTVNGALNFEAGNTSQVVTITATSSDGSFTTTNATINVTDVNEAPIAANDTDAVNEGSSITGSVATNDSDPDLPAQTLTYTLNAAAPAGLTFNSNGGYTFNAAVAAYDHLAQGATQVIAIPYTVTDPGGLTGTATLTITVTGTNDTPVATAASTVATEGSAPVSGQLVATDVDDGAVLTYSLPTAVPGLTINANGTYSFDPSNTAYDHIAQGATQTVVATYQVSDGLGGITTSTLTIVVTGTNDAPVAGADTASINEGAGILSGSVGSVSGTSGNDTDVDDGATRSYSFGSGLPAGFTGNADGTYTFDANNAAYDHLARGVTQTLTIPYTVTDQFGLSSSTTLTITVTGTNDAPVAVADAAAVNEGAGTITGNVGTNDSDVDDGATRTFALNGSAPAGFVFNSDGSYSFNSNNTAYDHLAQGVTQTLTIPYTVTDQFGATATANLVIVVTGTNDAPVAATATNTATEDGALATGTLTATDVDDGATRTFALNAPVAGLTVNVDGSYSFNPGDAAYQHIALGATQTVVANYTVTDQFGATSTSTLTIVVAGVNDAPVAVADSNTAVEGAAVVTGSVATNDSDVDDGATRTFALNGAAPAGFVFNANGSYSLDPTNGAYDHIALGATQTLTIPYTVTDNNGATATATLTIVITGTNDAPVAVADTNAAIEGGATISGSVATNDSDVDDGATRTFAFNGTLPAGFTGNANGSYTFDPTNAAYDHLAAGVPQTLTIPYTVTDNNGATATSALTIVITGTNDAPVAVADGPVAATEGGSVVTGNIGSNDTDVDDGATRTFALNNAAPAGFTLNGNTGGWSFDPTNTAYDHLAAGVTQTLTIPYTVTDNLGATATSSLTIVVTGTNDAVGPVTTVGSLSAIPELSPVGTVVGRVTATDVDDGSTVTYALTDDGGQRFLINATTGVITVANGNLLDFEQAASHNITVRATSSDGTFSSLTTTVTITDVNPENIIGSSLGALTPGGFVFSGNDIIVAGAGNDSFSTNVTTGGADTVNLGAGQDVVFVTSNTTNQVRLTFTSAEVGNGNPNESNTLANQDGGLGVRMQSEDGTGALTGPVSRFDDEGITFVSNTPGVTFDVRDLPSGVQRGDTFEVVTLGTAADDLLSAVQPNRAYYFNAGAGNDTIYGGNGNDFLVGGAGDDILAGLGGVNTLLGGAGNDTYYVNTADIVTEAVGGGNDIVYATSNYVLAANAEVETVVALGSTVSLTGSSTNNTLVGNAADNLLLGQDGDDYLVGADGNDTLYGGNGNDTIDGGNGNDILVGEGGTNVLIGGTGNDTYYVNTPDTVVELAGGGNDTVYALSNYVLAANSDVETLIAIGTAGSLTGSSINNTIIGNALDNVLSGLDGDDYLLGGDGNDTLYGGNGNDTLEGGNGNDTLAGEGGINVLIGGAGNDTYYVNSADTVIELAGGGSDTIYALGNYVLGSNSEIELLVALGTTTTLTGSATNNTIIGNALDNALSGLDGDDYLIGGDGNDVLYGGNGNDTLEGGNGNDLLVGEGGVNSLTGGAGNDTYYVNTADFVNEAAGGGNDIVYALSNYTLAANAEVETVVAIGTATTLVGSSTNNTLVGNALDNVLLGLDGNDYITGGAGNDILVGGNGSDTLEGGAGADQFRFAGGETGLDRILDFTSGTDKIALNGSAFAHTATIAFVSGAGAAANSANSTFLYDTTTGILSYDADGTGSGAAVQIANLGTGLTPSAGDFIFY